MQFKENLIYKLVSYLVVFPFFRGLFKGVTFGTTNVPNQGPLIIVANHGSHLDPPILGHALGRQVSFMAKEELFKIPLLGTIIKACGAYPVKRGASDREAIKVASSLLKEGRAIGVFIDGKRQRNGRVNSPKAGAALLAARNGAPLLPVAIINSHRALGIGSFWPRLISIHLRIGKPISPPKSRKKVDLEVTTEELQTQINLLLDKGLLKKGEEFLSSHS